MKMVKEYQWIYLEEYDCYFLERVPYCRIQEAPEQQCMNIFVPAAYMDQAGNKNRQTIWNGYTADSAPVIFENGLAGYRESEPFYLDDRRSAGKDFLKAGFVYVSCGCRGRSSVNVEGIFCGKAPLSLVDLKAGIRFLKANAENIPGNMSKIISVGVSAGGAMSALLGSTGNSTDYDEMLRETGAIMEQGDDIFAAQCYCPIIDLDHADLAYEWMFEGIAHYSGMPEMFSEGDLNEYGKELSRNMSRKYTEYFNGLKLEDPQNGEHMEITCGHGGSGAAYLKEKLECSATKFLLKVQKHQIPGCKTAEDYICGDYEDTKFDFSTKSRVSVPGTDKSKWLSWDGEKAVITEIKDMLENYHTRLKRCPAFDDLDMIQAENQEFGTSETDRMHFNTELFSIMETLKDQYPCETEKYLGKYQGITEDRALMERKKLMNPLCYIGNEKANLAPHFRIRVGSRDADTSLTITMALALKLMQTKKTNVDYEIVWDEYHGRADYPGEMIRWVNDI